MKKTVLFLAVMLIFASAYAQVEPKEDQKLTDSILAAYTAYQIYELYYDYGEYDSALYFIDQSILLSPDEASYTADKADCLYELGREREAIDLYDIYITQDPDFFYAYYKRGFIKKHTNDVDGAIEDYNKAITLNPTYAYSYVERGNQWEKKGEKEKAKKDYLKVIELDTIPSNESCAQYAYLALGDTAHAKEFMAQIIEQDSTEAGNYYDAACFYCKVGEFESALEFLKISLQLGFRRFAHINNDDDLEGIRNTPLFNRLIREYQARDDNSITDKEAQSNLYYFLSNLAMLQFRLGDYSEAIRMETDAIKICRMVFGEGHPDYAQSLNNLAFLHSVVGNYFEAITLGSEAAEIAMKLFGKEDLNYAISINNLADYYSGMKNYSKAINLQTDALEIIKMIEGTENADYANSLVNLANNHAHLGNYSEAIRLETEAMQILKKALGAEHPDYATSLNNAANYYANIGNYSEAIRLETEAIQILKKVLGTEHPTYATYLNNIANYYFYSGNYSEAIRLSTEAMEIRRKVLGSDHPDYAMSLNSLALSYSELGNYSKAIRYATEAMEICKRMLGTEHPYYARSLNSLASLYASFDNYSEAIRLATEAMEIRKRVLGVEHPDYATSLGNLAAFYWEWGNYSEAIRLGTEAVEISKKVLGSEHPDYASLLNNLGSYYSDIGNYSEAIRLSTEAMEIRKRVLGSDHPVYAMSLNNVATLYAHIGDDQEAIKLGTEAMGIQKKTLGSNHSYYATSLSNLASYYSHLGNYTEAIKLGTEAIEISKRILGAEHPDYAASLSNLAGCYYELGNYSEAIRLKTESVEILKKLQRIGHPDYATSLGELAGYYSDSGNYHQALELFKESADLWSIYLVNQLGTLTTKERESFSEMKSFYISSLYPWFVLNDKDCDDETIGDLYDKSALFAKGLLLNTDIELAQLVEESNDKELIEKYQTFRQDKLILDKLYEMPIEKRWLNADSIKQGLERLNRQLLIEVKEYGDCMRTQTINWHDVQNALSDDEIAIEFLNYFDVDNNSDGYVALLLKKSYIVPKLIPIFDNKQLDSGLNKIYDLVWRPLEKELQGVRNICFSPAGALHQWPIEYLAMDDGSLISDHYNLYRLSSTRLLVSRHDHTSCKTKTATLYGGLDYDATSEQLVTVNQGIQIKSSLPYNSNLIATRALVDSALYRSGCEYLEGSRLEVDSVMRELKAKGISVTAYTGVNGTEESFKALPGHIPSILLVSTHGFYWTESETERREALANVRFLQHVGNQATTIEDKALTRSGLMMAGCNRTLKGEPNNNDLEDGILTAKEISQLDLRGLDLVVLSACQTALGDLKGSEGVFGLQRGFKKAGAKSILMSLWKVNDLTTQLLMTEFYKYYLSGMSKIESLKKAQEYVRNYKDEDGNKLFEDPYFWAGFILLDALDQ